MSPSFPSREQEVRQLGKKLEIEVAEGDGDSGGMFEQVLLLPVSDLRSLQDTMLSLCDARLGGRDFERTARLEDFGARTIRYLGLFFDRETINNEFVPRLLSMVSNFEEPDTDTYDSRSSRYERIAALAQLAPRIDDHHLASVLEAALSAAGTDHEFYPELLLPLANFERVYRERAGENEAPVIERSRVLCLESIRSILETYVEALAGADHASVSNVIGVLPLLQMTGFSLLTILPSVVQERGTACSGKVADILDHCEWLLSRGEGFPGRYLQPSTIAMYDSVRSVLSVCTGMTGLHSTELLSCIETMKIARRKGTHRIGTLMLDLVRQGQSVEAVDFMRNVVRHELEREASPKARGLDLRSVHEVLALAWHLDIGDTSLVKAVLERTRDPRGQFYLHKALEGSPWDTARPGLEE